MRNIFAILTTLAITAFSSFGQENANLHAAKTHFSSASYDSAIKFYRKAIYDFESHNNRNEAFQATLSLTESLLKLNLFEEASLQIEILKNKYPSQVKVHLIDVLLLEADLFKRREDINEAAQLYDSLHKISTDPTITSKILIKKGYAFLANENLRNAKKAQLEAEKVIKKHEIKDSLVLAALWDLQGQTCWHTGDFAKAIRHFKRSLNYRLPVLGESHPEVGAIYGNIGIMYKNLMQYDKALEYYSLTLNQRKKTLGPNHLEVANSYNNIGYLLYKKELFDESMEFHEKAFQIRSSQLPPNHRRVLQSIEQIGLSYGGKGEFEQADSCFRKTLAFRTAKYGHNHHQVGYAYYNLGAVAVEERDYHKAADYFNTAIGIGKVVYGPHNYDQADNYNRYANCLLKLEDYESARRHFQLAIQNNIPGYTWNKDPHFVPSIDFYLSFREVLRSLIGMAYSYKSESTVEGISKGLAYLKEAEKVIYDFRSRISKDDDLVTISSSLKELADCATRLLYNINSIESNGFVKEEIFRYSELAKASALQSQLTNEKAKKNAGIPSKLLEKEQYFRLIKDSLNNAVISAMKNSEDQVKIEDIKTLLFEQNRAYENFIDSLETTFPVYAQQKFGIKPVDIQKIQQVLSYREIPTHLIQYHVFDEGDYLVSIVGKNTHEILLMRENELVQNIEDLRKNLEGKELLEPNESAFQVYQDLIGPIEKYIEEGANLIIIPDGLIGFVPFDILQKDTKDESYLMFDHIITYDFSATLFASRPEAITESSKILAFAPEFESTSTNDLRLGEFIVRSEKLIPLPGARKELESIKLHMNGLFLIGQNATEGQFKKEAHKYDIIHLATHSIVNEKDPKFSRLVFTPDDENDGLLHSFELSAIDLSARLVTLSACNTGIGKLADGEGVMSLARSFRSVGVPSVVMSLWPASDKSTPELMAYFYQNLKDGMTKDVALNNARKQYLKSAKGNARHPFYWGGFVLIGDISPITSSRSYFWVWVLATAVLVFTAVGVRKKL